MIKMKSEKVVKEVIKHLWDKRAHNFDCSPGHGIHSAEEKEAWKSLLAKALGNEKLDVLDVGCGTGVISLILAEMGHNVTGIDFSEGMVEKAKEKANSLNLHVEFKPGDAEDLQFDDASYDAVINRHLLWALPNPDRAISEWKRVLKPGGKIVIIDGTFGDYNRLHRQIWRYLVSMPLILITERRNPFYHRRYKQIERDLPLRHKKRPQADIEILENLGFSVDVTNVTIPGKLSFLGRLKYGHWGDHGHFLLKAIKGG